MKWTLAVLCVGCTSPKARPALPDAPTGPSFARDVAPILEQECAHQKGCHGAEPAEDVDMDLRHDIAVTVGARIFVPRVGPVSPVIDASIGYEWLTTKLVDGSGSSTRAYRGPVLLSVQVVAAFPLGPRWTLGPALGASIGVFTSYSLETNALSPSRAIPDGTLHGWLSIGARLGLTL